jgi:hypothetical protein
MAPAKLKPHLTRNHSHMTSKSAYYFKRLLESQNRVKLSLEKAQEASYLVAELIAQKRRSHMVRT